MPKVGDVVLYSVQGKTYNALVLLAHINQPDHLGENGEPLLHLAFIAPERESEATKARAGYLPQLFIEYDVHHASHEFTEEYKRANGLIYPSQIASQRGSGEWKEAGAEDEAAPAESLLKRAARVVKGTKA